MATDFLPLNENDTKEQRKSLKLPTTKDIRYLCKESGKWIEHKIVDYTISHRYQSGACTLQIFLDSGEEKYIHSDYLSDMQRQSFLNEQGDKQDGFANVKSIIDEGNDDKQEKVIVGSSDEYIIADVKNVSKHKQDVNNTKIGKRIDVKPNEYVIVDIETTGKNHFTDSIIEIGAIKYLNGKELDRFSVLIRDENEIPKVISELTGITNELLSCEGVDKFSAIMTFNNFIKDAIVVGHNFSSFDKYFLDDAYMDVLMCHFPNDYIDTLNIAKKELPDMEHYSLKDLAEEYGIDYSKAHRAIEDCIINHIVYELMTTGQLKEELYQEYLLENDSIQNDDSIVDVSANEIDGWKETVSRALTSVIDKRELPQNSIRLMANISRKNGNITSYSICICEPDLIQDSLNSKSTENNGTVLRIEDKNASSDSEILKITVNNKKMFNEIEVPNDAKGYEPNSGGPYIKISQKSNNLVQYLECCVGYAIDHYSSKNGSFACCARYMECSKEMKCVHRNRLFSKACEYRKNIESGKIFY